MHTHTHTLAKEVGGGRREQGYSWLLSRARALVEGSYCRLVRLSGLRSSRSLAGDGLTLIRYRFTLAAIDYLSSLSHRAALYTSRCPTSNLSSTRRELFIYNTHTHTALFRFCLSADVIHAFLAFLPVVLYRRVRVLWRTRRRRRRHLWEKSSE